jgi:WD40 repeat protein
MATGLLNKSHADALQTSVVVAEGVIIVYYMCLTAWAAELFIFWSDAKENHPPAAGRPLLTRTLEAELVLGEAVKGNNDFNSSQKTSSGHEVFCVRYSPDGQFVAAARGNGSIDVYSATKGNKVYELPSDDVNGAAPTCCIRFRPNTTSSKTRNVLLAVDAGGKVSPLATPASHTHYLTWGHISWFEDHRDSAR